MYKTNTAAKTQHVTCRWQVVASLFLSLAMYVTVARDMSTRVILPWTMFKIVLSIILLLNC